MVRDSLMGTCGRVSSVLLVRDAWVGIALGLGLCGRAECCTGCLARDSAIGLGFGLGLGLAGSGFGFRVRASGCRFFG